MDTWSGHAQGGGGQGGMGPQYIPRLCVTGEYIALYSSVIHN
jgi:hypothetical protein